MSIAETEEDAAFFESEAAAEAEAEAPVVEDVEEPVADEPVVEEPKLVPLNALHESREINREMRAENQKLVEQNARMEERFKEVMARIDQPKEEIPDVEEDPAAFLIWQAQQQEKGLAETNKRLDEDVQSRHQQQAQQQFVGRIQTDEASYRSTAPEYNDAVAFVRDRKMADFGQIGLEPEEAMRAYQGEIMFMSENAYRSGKNPAEVLHGIAKSWGFAPPESEAPNPADKQIERQQKAAAVGSRMSGGGEENTVSLARLAELDGDEFDKAWNKMKSSGALG